MSTGKGDHFLSARSAPARQPPLAYWPAFSRAAFGGDAWSPANPGGFIPLAVAENRLSTDLVAAGLLKHAAAELPPAMLHYQDMRGIPQLRAAICELAAATFMQGVRLDPDCLSVLSGLGAAIDLLVHSTCDPGDAVLIPAPFYPAFVNDLAVRNGVAIQPVRFDLTEPEADLGPALQAAAQAAEAGGHRVRALLFTHPTNPDGLLYSRPQLASLLRWCLGRRVHCISDEVYALSVFDQAAAFTSMAQLLDSEVPAMPGAEAAGELVHLLFGFSKDFCGSGLRLGCLYSANAGLNEALGNLAYFCSTPGPLQWTVTRLLSDQAWLGSFLAENRARLRAAYATVTRALDAAGLPYTKASGGMFVWADLSAALRQPGSSSEPSWEDEAAFWDYLVESHKLVLTPGSTCMAERPGCFRLCFAWPPAECLPVALERLVSAVRQFPAWRLEHAAA